jgi:diguanylate cyclase (GGDEF)-like protein
VGTIAGNAPITAFGLAAARGKRPLLDVAMASLAVGIVGILDDLAPSDLDATALYLGIIAITAWRAIAAVAIVTALSAWTTSIVLDLAGSPADVPLLALWNGGAGLAIFLGVAVLVRKARQERDALRAAATHDTLTGLPNRALFGDRLEQALLVAERDKAVVGVLSFDLDGFKRVNDTMGHHAGDQLLRLVAARVRSAIRASDTCARVGGDEFVVLLPRTTRAGAMRVADTLRRECAQPFHVERADLSIAASFGTALSPDDGVQPETLLRVADARMYEAKTQRRAAIGPATD